ncbi:MAG: hypothetical protein P4L27_07295 [Ignavibacteriaceae bacterium]|nr:hypothetical protein [Ignavibacteriaceae bacterium]
MQIAGWVLKINTTANAVIFFSNDEKDMALQLFKDGFETEQYHAGSKNTKSDFIEFAKRISINKIRFNKIYNSILAGSPKVEKLVSSSFLKDSFKTQYLNNYFLRLDRLKS